MNFINKCSVCKEGLFDTVGVDTRRCFKQCTHLYIDDEDNIFLQLRLDDLIAISRFIPDRYEIHIYDPAPILPYYDAEKALTVVYCSDIPEEIQDTYSLSEYLLSFMNKLVKYKSFV